MDLREFTIAAETSPLRTVSPAAVRDPGTEICGGGTAGAGAGSGGHDSADVGTAEPEDTIIKIGFLKKSSKNKVSFFDIDDISKDSDVIYKNIKDARLPGMTLSNYTLCSAELNQRTKTIVRITKELQHSHEIKDRKLDISESQAMIVDNRGGKNPVTLLNQIKKTIKPNT